MRDPRAGPDPGPHRPRAPRRRDPQARHHQGCRRHERHAPRPVRHHGPTSRALVAITHVHPDTCTRTERLENDHGPEWRKTKHTRLDELDPVCGPDHDLKTNHGWDFVKGKGRRAMVPPDDPRHPNYRAPPTSPAARVTAAKVRGIRPAAQWKDAELVGRGVRGDVGIGVRRVRARAPGSAATQPEKPDTTMVSSTSVVLTAARTTLKCADQVGWLRTPPGVFRVVRPGGAPDQEGVQRGSPPPSQPNSKFWAKAGLVDQARHIVRADRPGRMGDTPHDRVGKPGHATTHLWVTSCRSRKAGAHWLAFAGGFTVNKPACVPLIVKAANEQRTVHIGVGKACPGQAPPRN